MARVVVEVIRAEPNLPGRAVALRANRRAVLERLTWSRGLCQRRVRELVWVARDVLGVPVIAKSGEGYRVAATLAEAMEYAEATRQMGREYFALAERVERAATRAFAGQLDLGLAGPT